MLATRRRSLSDEARQVLGDRSVTRAIDVAGDYLVIVLFILTAAAGMYDVLFP